MRPAWSIPTLWPGETVVIIAGGPSLSLAQVRHVAMARLEDKCRVICINDAVYLAWWADWLHACDFKWWNWHRNTATKFAGIRTTLTETVPEPWAQFLKTTACDPKTGRYGGWTEAPDEVQGVGSSGGQAMQCAAKAGAKKLILLGFDMKPGPGDQAHWFGEHPDGMRSDYAETMLPNFPPLAKALKERGVEVVNCTPDSALKCFPNARLKDVL